MTLRHDGTAIHPRSISSRRPRRAARGLWLVLAAMRAAWRDVIDGRFIPSAEFRAILRQICG